MIDFGIAQLHEEKEQPPDRSRYLGTPNYMSPEQKENPSSVTLATDIYSLGVILYELITGKLSYGMINLTALPKGLQKIAAKTLAVSVKERYKISLSSSTSSPYTSSRATWKKSAPAATKPKRSSKKYSAPTSTSPPSPPLLAPDRDGDRQRARPTAARTLLRLLPSP